MGKRTSILEKKTTIPKKKRGGLTAPDFDSLFDASGLPELPEIDGGEAEAVAKRETDDMMQLIRENRKNNAERFRDVESGEFWFCVCFQSRSQKDAFLIGLLAKFAPQVDIEQLGDKYLSGLELAEMLGIPITLITLEAKRSKLAPKSLRGMEVID